MARIESPGAGGAGLLPLLASFGLAWFAGCAQLIGAGDYEVDPTYSTGAQPGSGGDTGSGGTSGEAGAGGGAECTGEFPVACGERDGAPSDCWSEGTDCASIVSCDGVPSGCKLGFSADCSSDSCFSASATQALESSDAACSNQLDDDGDGFVDCQDLACLTNPSVEVCNAENTDRKCSGGLDEDEDSYVDCNDGICLLSPAVTLCGAPEVTSVQCSNGIDDNADGYTDCDDWLCLLSLFSGCVAGIGDACFTGDRCSSGICTGYASSYAGILAGSCTVMCTSTAACGTGAAGAQNHCISGQGAGDYCYPGCTTIEDCITRFGAGSSCVSVPDVSGATVSVCMTTAREIGTRAYNPAECASSVAVGYCSTSCASNEDCGANIYSQWNYCSEGYCFAGCDDDQDCAVYGEGAECAPINDATGAPVSGCVVSVPGGGA